MSRSHSLDLIPMPDMAPMAAYRTLLEAWVTSGKSVNIIELVDSVRSAGSALPPLTLGEATAFSYSFPATPEEIEAIFALRSGPRESVTGSAS